MSQKKKTAVTVYIRKQDRSYEPANIRKDYPKGTTFVMRYTDPATGKRKWETLDNKPYPTTVTSAFMVARKRQDDLRKVKPDQSVEPAQPAADKGRSTLRAAIDKYMEDVRARKAKDTIQRYEYVLEEFQSDCAKQYLDEITVDDLKAYVAQMKEAELADRTIDNRLTYMGVFLHASGISKDVKLHHRYTEKVVEAYTAEELDALFKACDQEERELFSFFAMTGMRDQEVAHVRYKDINWKGGYVTVKEREGWTTKGRKERRIPVPDSLLKALQERRRKYQDAELIFPDSKGKPNQHYLRILKRVVKRAGLPGEWILHKFRKTFATWHHDGGISPRTIQEWLGHESLETTLAYLAVADIRSERTRQAVNGTFAVFGEAQ